MSKILHLNHELYRRHYGEHEYQRLRPIFETEPEELTHGADWEVPPIIEASYKIRLLVMAGVPCMRFMQKLLSDKAVCDQIKAFIFVENDPKVISHLINHPHFAAFLTHDAVKCLFLETEDSIRPNLFRILKQPNYSEIMELAGVYFSQNEPDEKSREFYKNIDSCVRETAEHVYNNYGRIDDSLEGVKATFLNGQRIFDCPGILEMQDFYKGKPAIVVGAGPSLDKAIPILKEHQSKCVILAADAAVKPLISAGIYPNFTTSIERFNLYQEPFWRDLDPKHCQLVCFPVIHPKVIELYKGPIRVVYRNYAYYAYFEKNWPKGIMHCGGSTTNLAIRLAHFMGCSEIILAGVDHSYEKGEGDLYRSHCAGTGDPSWEEWHTLEEFIKPPKNHAPAFEVPANNGEQVMTNFTYYLWSKEFAEELRNLSIPITDTAERGVKMSGIPYVPLDQILSAIQPSEIKMPPMTNTMFYKKWEHGMLEQSIQGWIRLSQSLLKLLEEGVDEQHYRYISDLYNIKFIREDLFISFVLQNCAVEYYRIQNEFNGLESGLHQLDKHIDIMKRRFELFLRVLEPLDKIMKETKVA